LRQILIIATFLIIISCSCYADTVLKKIDIANIAVDAPSEILIEKGWTKYVSFNINNTGQTNIYQISAYIVGSPSSWFEMQSYRINSLPMGKDTPLTGKLLVPLEARSGDYKFALRVDSNEISYEKDFVVRVFSTRDEMLNFQIDSLEAKLKEIEQKANEKESGGLNLSFARQLVNEIRGDIATAQDDVQKKMYSQVTESIRNIEGMLIKADYEVTNPPIALQESSNNDFNLPLNEIMFFSPLAIGIIACVSIVFLVKKNKIKNAVRLPNLKVREAIVENPKIMQINSEIAKINETRNTLEDEYKQGIISKESYDEIRIKDQEKIFDLETEKRKLKGSK
jgi:hypothetical protein